MARPIRTFLDSGVLIAAYKGSPSIEAPASNILDDPNRVFLSSPFVRHEVSPKALYNRQLDGCPASTRNTLGERPFVTI